MKTGHELQTMLDDVLHDDRLDALKEDLRLRCVSELTRKRRNRLKVWMIPAAAAILFVGPQIVQRVGVGHLGEQRIVVRMHHAGGNRQPDVTQANNPKTGFFLSNFSLQ